MPPAFLAVGAHTPYKLAKFLWFDFWGLRTFCLLLVSLVVPGLLLGDDSWGGFLLVK